MPGVAAVLTADDLIFSWQLLRDKGRPNHRTYYAKVAKALATFPSLKEIEVIEIEQPRPRYMPSGRRIAASYINFYVANGAVVMPAFEDPQDTRAFEAVTRAFPGREIVQVPALDIVFGDVDR